MKNTLHRVSGLVHIEQHLFTLLVVDRVTSLHIVVRRPD